jgi:uncharacterized membrane protein YgcG
MSLYFFVTGEKPAHPQGAPKQPTLKPVASTTAKQSCTKAGDGVVPKASIICSQDQLYKFFGLNGVADANTAAVDAAATANNSEGRDGDGGALQLLTARGASSREGNDDDGENIMIESKKRKKQVSDKGGGQAGRGGGGRQGGKVDGGGQGGNHGGGSNGGKGGSGNVRGGSQDCGEVIWAQY